MKRITCLLACMILLVVGSGCCCHRPWLGGGCPGGACGYGAGYGAVTTPGAYYTGTAMQAGVPAYTAGAPIYAPTTAYAPINPLPTY